MKATVLKWAWPVIAVMAAFVVLAMPEGCEPLNTEKEETTETSPEDTLSSSENGKFLYVSKARQMEGATGVWVYGYIIGNASPFMGTTSATNLAISGKAKPAGKEDCMSVELKKGALRDALNLVDNPSLIGIRLFIKGDIIKYYGIPGIKNISAWSIESIPTEED